jgi:hypothetical protein
MKRRHIEPKIDCRKCKWDGVPGASHKMEACYGCGDNGVINMKHKNPKKSRDRWAKLCKYINRRRDGALITRHNIMAHLWPGSDQSIDTYRNYLTRAGFLVIIRPGRYLKVKTIPHKMSRRDVQRLGYDVSNYNKGW